MSARTLFTAARNRLCAGIAAAGLFASMATAETGGLRIFAPEQPVSFFFRDTEASAALRRLSYEEWNARYSRLAGVMGKMLDEEVMGRSAGQPYFRRFKGEHPDQAVLLHANGTFRSPKADNRAYYAGHWLYYNGSPGLDALPAQPGRLTLRVADASVFNASPYRVNPAVPEDVGICLRGADGKPDWSRAEQAALVGVDSRNSTITIQRGVYGATPQSFAAGEAYVAAHVAQTWGTTNKLWQLNMATTCPRNASNQTAADVWAAELTAAMRAGGALEFVDGVEFDVPFRRPMLLGRGRQADCDADGVADNGIVGGVPVFALGVDHFFHTLRRALPEKLILADVGDKEQRSVATLNGVETEGWPKLKDPNFLYWSTALNNHRYWGEHARPPVFTYGLMKFLGEGDVPFSRVRLTIAGPLLVGAAVPMGYSPPAGSNGVWDELLGGALNRRGWLGRAVGPTRWFPEQAPDLFGGRGLTLRCTSADARVKVGPQQIEAAATDAGAAGFSVRLSGLELRAPTDVVVGVEASATLSAHEHPDAYRVLSAALVKTGSEPEWLPSLPSAPVAPTPFRGRYYFRGIATGSYDLILRVEGAEPVVIRAVSAHAAADVAVREFEHGVVLANPSFEPRRFELGALFPGVAFKRLQATVAQDDKVNNGAAVDGSVTVPAKDALFLLKSSR